MTPVFAVTHPDSHMTHCRQPERCPCELAIATGVSGARTSRPPARARRASMGRMPWPRLKMWPGASARPGEHVVGRRERAIERSEQQRRIQIALNRAIEPDALPRFVERRAPVGADHGAARLAQLAEDRACAHAEVNRGHVVAASASNIRPRVRQDELAVVARVQCADPRIEHLHGVHAGLDLRDQIVGDDVGQQRAEPVPRGRMRRTSAPSCGRSCSDGPLRSHTKPA